jgi:hypothetical protein
MRRLALLKALSVVRVGIGIFWKRPSEAAFTGNMVALRAAYEGSGGRVVEYDKMAELLPGVWLAGPIPRKYPREFRLANGMNPGPYFALETRTLVHW